MRVSFHINRRDSDVILAEPISVASTLSLFMCAMLCGARFSFTNRIVGRRRLAAVMRRNLRRGAAHHHFRQ